MTRKERAREVKIGEHWKISNGSRNLRLIEVIVGEVQPLEMIESKEGVVGVDRARQTTAAKIEPNYMTSPLITLDPVP